MVTESPLLYSAYWYSQIDHFLCSVLIRAQCVRCVCEYEYMATCQTHLDWLDWTFSNLRRLAPLASVGRLVCGLPMKMS